MKKHVYLMRHGETLFNQLKKIQGWCDSPLTPKGIAQAKAAGELIKEVNFDHYYSSTSERCCDTLEIVTNNLVPYTRLKGLKERNFGSFEGESEALNPPRNGTFGYDDLFPHYGGEYYSETQERVVSTIKEFIEKEDHETVLAVSHGGASFSFLDSVTDPSDVQNSGGLTNCCILHFTYEEGQFEFVDIMRPELAEID